MALTSPGLVLSVEALFGAIKPRVDILKTIGATDFSAAPPNVDIKPGATVKVPVSSITAATAYDKDTNNYRTGGDTSWATLTATHFLKGYDISGENVDQGVNASRMKQLFAVRAGGGISAAMANTVASALDGVTASTAVTLPAAPTLTDYINLASAQKWLDKSQATLVVNGSELALLRGAAAEKHLAGSDEEIARFIGVRAIALMPGMTARAVLAPESSVGFMGRVPTIIARYVESGVETDEDSGLSVGIVVADDQDHNRLVVNADLWFGCTVLSAPANAGTAGAIKVGTGA